MYALADSEACIMSRDLQEIASTLVARGKGILAADETVPTLTRRFDALGIPSTEQKLPHYRECGRRRRELRDNETGAQPAPRT
jgi:fructose-bisphosphate aldolase class I